MADKHLKKWPVSLIIRKVPVKITMRYHFISVKMAAIFFFKKAVTWRGCGEIGIFVHCCWEYKMMQPLWKRVCWFLKKLKIALPYDPQFHPEELKAETPEDICT